MTRYKNVSLAELLDVILDKGVVISGDIFISIAGIELVYVDLRVLVGSLETIQQLRSGISSQRTLPSHD